MAHKVRTNSVIGYVLLPIHIAYALLEQVNEHAAMQFLKQWVNTDNVENSANPFEEERKNLRIKCAEADDPNLRARIEVVAEENTTLSILWELAKEEVWWQREEI